MVTIQEVPLDPRYVPEQSRARNIETDIRQIKHDIHDIRNALQALVLANPEIQPGCSCNGGVRNDGKCNDGP